MGMEPIFCQPIYLIFNSFRVKGMLNAKRFSLHSLLSEPSPWGLSESLVKKALKVPL